MHARDGLGTPGASTGDDIPFQQYQVLHPSPGEVVQHATSHHSAADDDGLRCLAHGSSSNFLRPVNRGRPGPGSLSVAPGPWPVSWCRYRLGFTLGFRVSKAKLVGVALVGCQSAIRGPAAKGRWRTTM